MDVTVFVEVPMGSWNDEHFFQVDKDLEEKKTGTRGYGNRAEAEHVIEAARARAASG